ncbi:zinc finger protein basonuclin-2 isoform X3 [Hippoglossus hippoglossus]|uniref:zinc finger protein basonuclin-2 isoform X3 n=1 Tax=Hippoglossus hippoglossus TaxID=8267 RepID=UPI00148D29F2|nr:zinc finger protein basonuclin-2 isoform X3 [Hippoglossus hippoglossus]XP_035031354.1 zinc finger protein basonuclin-2 isoform X1 [Hippoglossus stenolepis]XP_035031364.1 zinc finger protein basonuclin-2 isoform X2 [Hippoglossus stenolepis]
MSKEADLDVRGSECDTVPPEPSTDPEVPRPPPAKANGPHDTAGACTSIPSGSHSSSSSSRSGLGGISIVSSSAEGAGESSMQFSTRPPSAEQPGFMGTWQQQSTDSNLLYRMSQQAIRCTLVNCTCECFQPGKIHLRTCDQCKHGWVAHALDKLSTQHLYHPTQVEIVQSNVVFDISSLMLYGTQAVPVRLKILLDRLFSVLKQEEVLHILHGLGWTLRDYVRGYILQDTAGKVLDRWSIMSREEEIITLQQFLRFGETKSIVELMAIQEKEGQAVTVPSSKTDSGIRTFIESNSRTRSPGLLTHLETSSPSSIHHFENIPNSLAFLLPFQYINPVSAPMLGLPPNGLPMEQSALRLREPSLPNQGEQVETSESEVSLSPFRSGQSPNRGALGAINNNIEPKTEPNNRASPISPTPSTHQSQQQTQLQQGQQQSQNQSQQSNSLSDHQVHHHFVKDEQSKTITHSSFSSKMHRMRRMGSTSRKGRVCCNSCGKTFYDKGTLKIHYNAVHLKIKHRCTIEGCNMVFSSLRSRNRHSANPNPRLHMPMLRNNRDKDLIRSNSAPGTPVISSTKNGGFTLTSPGRPPLGFTTPPVDPMLQSPLQSPLVFPSLKSVQPVQPVPPFYRTLLSPADLVSPPVSLPTSPILPTATNSTSLMDQHLLAAAVASHNNVHMSEAGPMSHRLPTPSANNDLTSGISDPTPKKKPRKSSMPVKIEKEVIDVADEYDDKDEDDEDNIHRNHHHHQSSLLHNNIKINGNCNSHNSGSGNGNHSGGSGQQSPSQDEMSPGLALRGMMRQSEDECREGNRSDSRGGNDLRSSGELRCMDSFTSEDQDHERDFENESENSDSKMFYRDELMDVDEHPKHSRVGRGLDKEQDDEANEEAHLRKEMEGKGLSSPSPHHHPMKIKEELNDPTYDMFCMGQYGIYNGGMAAAAAAAASMAALHESFISSMGYGASPPKFLSSQSPEGDPCSSPDPKICYVCKKTFKSSYSMKLHYKNVHLKEMHVCTVAGCNAAFPSRRSRDRHSSNINLHRKLLTKELDDIVLDPQLTPLPKDLRAEILAKIYAGHHMGLDPMAGMGIGGASLGHTGLNHDARSPMSNEYFHHPLSHNLKNHHTNGFSHGQPDDYMVLDLSTTSSVQSSSSVHSSHESDEGSDEGILLDDLEEEDGEEDEEEGNSEGEDCSQRAERQAEIGQRDETGELRGEGHGEGLEPPSSPFLLSSTGGSNSGGSGILCNICHKMYSNKGTLRVHYKTVHLREMHKCKIPGCNMVFSSVRSRNRHSQNPNLHKNMPFSTIID